MAQVIAHEERRTVFECLSWSRPADYVLLPDPDLEPGFPVKAFHAGGGYQGGQAVHTLVGDMDGDPELEIVVSGLGSGMLYAWNHDGSLLPGWPTSGYWGAPYQAMGELSASNPGQEVFSGHHTSASGLMMAFDRAGRPLPGWPRDPANYVSSPASIADVDGDGSGDIFIQEEDAQMHAYRADGTILPGWPYQWRTTGIGGQYTQTPSIVDLDRDGSLDVVAVTGWTTAGALILAIRSNGTAVRGFPIVKPLVFVITFAAIGDVDGDGEYDIVMVTPLGFQPYLQVFSHKGILKLTRPTTHGVSYGTAPALADLDGDGIPEIIVYTDGAIDVWKGDGQPFPGWPQVWSTYGHEPGYSAPVVGDVDGDQQPDILVTDWVATTGHDNEVRVFDRYGQLHSRFPKVLPAERGAVPAIADLDLDGRNEIVVTGTFWNGLPGDYDKVWAFDLGGGPHGAVHWGQLQAEASHRGVYPLGLTPLGTGIDDSDGGNGNAVLEPGEEAAVSTRWRNMGTSTRTLTGAALEFTGPDPGGQRRYVLLDANADHGEVREGASTDCKGVGGDCYRVGIGRSRPLQHWDATLLEGLSTGPRKAWPVHVGDSFADVSRSSPFYRFVETLLHTGVTGGCWPQIYCPSAPVTREQMAAFVLTAKEGRTFAPPPCTTPMFADVPAASPYCRWIEELARRGVVSGCGGGNYCPGAHVTRQEMAVFVLRTLDPALTPLACTNPPFGDLLRTSPFCPWIAELHRRGIVGGCGGEHYCPTAPVTREQMSVFITLTFGLNLYGR